MKLWFFSHQVGEECVNLTVYSVDQDESGGAAVTYLPCGNELATSHDEEQWDVASRVEMCDSKVPFWVYFSNKVLITASRIEENWKCLLEG